MTAIVALLVDAYRELNHKKLFWVTLALSGVVIIVYASIGFTPTGMSLFFGIWQPESEWVNSNTSLSRIIYRSIFTTVMVGTWLTWIATILALVSTTTIFPDFMAGGSIDLVLSKPLSRIKLFFLKYFFGLLFVFLQVTIFCVGVFICMGWRIGEWEPMIFAAIPLVTIFFSYLFSVNVLIGTITRSALVALLLTLLLWFSLFGLSFAENILHMIRTTFEVQAEFGDTRVENLEGQLSELPEDSDQRVSLELQLERAQEERDDAWSTEGKIAAWHEPIKFIRGVFPKTQETIALLDRWLTKEGDIPLGDILNGNFDFDADGNVVVANRGEDREVGARMEAEIAERSVFYVVGTSLIFEVVVVGLACVIFVRRDY